MNSRSKRFENCGDGGWQWLWFDDNYPAGEYFFAASDVSGNIGVYKFNDNSGSLGLAYINGLQYSYDFQLGVNIPQTATKPYFTKILTYKDTTNGENQAPPEYKIPEDSYINKVQPSTWVFTDGLGRESLTYDDVGAVKSDKVMAMFFWDWHDDYIGKQPVNIQSVMDKYPEAKTDYDHPAWPEDKLHTHKFFWNEPVYGYYGRWNDF